MRTPASSPSAPWAAVALACLFSPACLAGSCAVTVDELRTLVRHPAFPLRWQETSMQDGKPLLVTLSERQGGLHLQFVKAQEGLWAEGEATVCLRDGAIEALLSRRRIGIGPAAHWLLQHSLGGGARFVLALQPGGQLRIATPGWSGTFTPARE